MGALTKIEWADHTFNPVLGCSHVSLGCKFCYAEAQNVYREWVQWGPQGERRRTASSTWHQPRRWNADAARFFAQNGRRQRVFCGSLCDWLDEDWPEPTRDDLRKLIDETPDLDWLLLSKRPKNARKLVPIAWWGRPNVWFGISAEDEQNYRERWPEAVRVPAAVHFISYEPALGPLGPLDFWMGKLPQLVISGGESGPNARPVPRSVFQNVRNQCAWHGISYLHKQNGEWIDADELAELRKLKSSDDPPLNFEAAEKLAKTGGWRFQHFSDGSTAIRVGKSVAGRTLEGRWHDAMPVTKISAPAPS